MLLDKSQLSILLIDDDEMGLDMLERRLHREEFNVETANCGAAAIERIEVEKFDVILLDLMMPDMSGDEVLEKIRASKKTGNAVVIMLTADSDRESVNRCLTCGADDYIVKPYDFLLLKTRIWRALKGRPISNRGNLSDKELLVGKHVLIVDDDENNRDILTRRCEQFGCLVESVTNGEDALQAVSEKSFDAVLLDIHMPGMDGVEVLKTIRSQQELDELPVMMVSAEDNPKVLTECVLAGASDYISKPFNAAVIRGRLQTCLRRPEEEQSA